MYSVYVLRCRDGSLYTGITTDLERRVREHQAGNGSRYVKTRRPVRVVYQESRPDRSSALRRELEIKALSKPGKERLVRKGA